MKSNIMLILVMAASLVGCGTLDPQGPYKGNKALYTQDAGIRASYDVLHLFVSWEYENRAALAKTPGVKVYADYVRKNSQKWVSTAIALRDAYAGSPTQENLTAFQTAMAVLREAMLQATQYLTTSTQ